jgi:hypothetical protein
MAMEDHTPVNSDRLSVFSVLYSHGNHDKLDDLSRMAGKLQESIPSSRFSTQTALAKFRSICEEYQAN